jgi:hypothetical protein
VSEWLGQEGQGYAIGYFEEWRATDEQIAADVPADRGSAIGRVRPESFSRITELP